MLVLGGKFTLFSDGLFAGESLFISEIFMKNREVVSLQPLNPVCPVPEMHEKRRARATACATARATARPGHFTEVILYYVLIIYMDACAAARAAGACNGACNTQFTTRERSLRGKVFTSELEP